MAIQTIIGIAVSDPTKATLAISKPLTSNAKAGGGAPAGKAGGGGGAPKAKAASGSSSSSSTSGDTKIYDPMDINKDSTVSAQEKAQYLLMHPEEAAKDTHSMNYTGQGSLSENQGGLAAIINLSV